MTAVRSVILGSCLLAFAAGCSSSHSSTASTTPTSTPGATTSTTGDPDNTPNPIPYVPGEKIGLSHGWLVTVTKVHQSFSAPGLAPPPSGQQYVALYLTMQNQSTTAETVTGSKLFFMSDSTGKIHDLVTAPGAPASVDGVYAPNSTHSGRIVFLVPLHRDLMFALDGPLIGTQQSVWTIVPPTVPAESS